MLSNQCFEKAAHLGEMLIARKYSLAVAESCTGGLIGGALTAVAGSSAYFKGGVIAYSNEVKIEMLGVPATIIKEHGAVSTETVEAMARGAANLFDCECAVAVSGIAGPGGQTPGKPVGLIYFGLYTPTVTKAMHRHFIGDRHQVRLQAVEVGLDGLLGLLS
jgi:nicotinamide-nucleotide amidase